MANLTAGHLRQELEQLEDDGDTARRRSRQRSGEAAAFRTFRRRMSVHPSAAGSGVFGIADDVSTALTSSHSGTDQMQEALRAAKERRKSVALLESRRESAASDSDSLKETPLPTTFGVASPAPSGSLRRYVSFGRRSDVDDTRSAATFSQEGSPRRTKSATGVEAMTDKEFEQHMFARNLQRQGRRAQSVVASDLEAIELEVLRLAHGGRPANRRGSLPGVSPLGAPAARPALQIKNVSRPRGWDKVFEVVKRYRRHSQEPRLAGDRRDSLRAAAEQDAQREESYHRMREELRAEVLFEAFGEFEELATVEHTFSYDPIDLAAYKDVLDAEAPLDTLLERAEDSGLWQELVEREYARLEYERSMELAQAAATTEAEKRQRVLARVAANREAKAAKEAAILEAQSATSPEQPPELGRKQSWATSFFDEYGDDDEEDDAGPVPQHEPAFDTPTQRDLTVLREELATLEAADAAFEAETLALAEAQAPERRAQRERAAAVKAAKSAEKERWVPAVAATEALASDDAAHEAELAMVLCTGVQPGADRGLQALALDGVSDGAPDTSAGLSKRTSGDTAGGHMVVVHPPTERSGGSEASRERSPSLEHHGAGSAAVSPMQPSALATSLVSHPRTASVVSAAITVKTTHSTPAAPPVPEPQSPQPTTPTASPRHAPGSPTQKLLGQRRAIRAAMRRVAALQNQAAAITAAGLRTA